MLSIGLSLTSAAVLGGSSFSPASLFAASEAGAWYDPSDLSTLWQDTGGTVPVTSDGDSVARIDDKSGNGNHATQATSSKRPVYKTSGGLHWLRYDGVDDSQKAEFTITQTIDRVSGIRQVAWGTADQVFGSPTTAAAVLTQRGAPPELQLYSGSFACSETGATIGSDAVVTERHGGASSRLAVDNNSYSTGNAGTLNPEGVVLASNESGVACASIRLHGVVEVARALTDAEITDARSYMAQKQGRSL